MIVDLLDKKETLKNGWEFRLEVWKDDEENVAEATIVISEPNTSNVNWAVFEAQDDEWFLDRINDKSSLNLKRWISRFFYDRTITPGMSFPSSYGIDDMKRLIEYLFKFISEDVARRSAKQPTPDHNPTDGERKKAENIAVDYEAIVKRFIKEDGVVYAVFESLLDGAVFKKPV